MAALLLVACLTIVTAHAGAVNFRGVTVGRADVRLGPMRRSKLRKEVKRVWRSKRFELTEEELAQLAGNVTSQQSRTKAVLAAPRRMRGQRITQGKDRNPRSDLRLYITGGDQRGRRLAAPDVYIRPMMARVREALFSMLHDLSGIGSMTTCLDLFSGSGCVGLEMLSRGCGQVASVDLSAECVRVMELNARACGYEGRHTAICARAEDVLLDPSRYGVPLPVDMITLTPPYEEVPPHSPSA